MPEDSLAIKAIGLVKDIYLDDIVKISLIISK